MELSPADLAITARDRHGDIVLRLPATQEQHALGQHPFEVVVGGWRFEATVELAARALLRERAQHLGDQRRPAGPTTINAQIPGRIVSIAVRLGQAVEAGETLLAIEAMKMANEVRAPRAGTVERISVAVDDRVDAGAELVVVG